VVGENRLTTRNFSPRFPGLRTLTAASVAVALVLVGAGLASAAPLPGISIRTFLGHPYSPANESLGSSNYTQGCGHWTIRAPPVFSNLTGAGSAGVAESAYACSGSQVSQDVVQAAEYLEFPINASSGHVGVDAKITIATTWAWNLTTGSCSVSSNTSNGLCQAFTQFQDYAYIQLFDPTSGTAHTSTEFLAGATSTNFIGYCFSGTCSPWSNTSISSGAHTVTTWTFKVHEKLKAGDQYELLVFVGDSARTWLSSSGSATLTGAYGSATGEFRFVMPSIAVI
jgi:hypothetical protein